MRRTACEVAVDVAERAEQQRYRASPGFKTAGKHDDQDFDVAAGTSRSALSQMKSLLL